jgi:hypothetical protein
MKPQTIWIPLRIVTLLLLCLSGVAQERPSTPVKHELALAVELGGEYETIEIPAFNGGYAGVASFRRIKSWQPSTGEALVNDLIFKIAREAEIVIAHLSARLENDKEVLVGTYRVNEGDAVMTDALTKFGLEPLVLRVVKAKPSFKDPLPPIMPKVENKTNAIEVVGFHQESTPSNSFRLTLRNVSSKNIIALDLFMPSADGNGGGGQRDHGFDKAHPLMLPGGIVVRHVGVSRGGRMTPDGFVPDAALQRTLIIRTVVFDDGTYEGLVEPAAEIEAQRRGLDIQRKRILRLLQEPQKTNEGDVLTPLSELKEQAYALEKIVDASVARELMALFPSLDEKAKGSVLQTVEGGLRDGKLELLRYISDFEEMQKQPGEHITFAEWIKQTKTAYEKLTTAL